MAKASTKKQDAVASEGSNEELKIAVTDTEKDTTQQVVTNETNPPAVDKTPEVTQKATAWKFWEWRGKKLLVVLVPLLLILIGGLALAMPASRLAIRNILSSASVSVVVVDASTEQPLEGVTVRGDGVTEAETNEEGVAEFSEVSFGDLELSFSKESYEAMTVSTNVKDSEMMLDTVMLTPTGIPFEIMAENFLTSDEVSDFTVTIKDSENSVSAVEGVATLNLNQDQKDGFSATISAEGYNDKSVDFDEIEVGDAEVELVLAGKNYFLSNRNGTIGLYESLFDGSGQEQIIEDVSSTQDASVSFSVSPDSRYAVLQSPRKGERDDDNFLLSELYVIDLESGSIELFDEGAKDWQILAVENDKVVYTINKGDQDLEDNQKIKTYSFADKDLETLVSQSRIDEVRYIDGYALYTDTVYRNNYPYGYSQADFYKVNTSTGDAKQIESKQFIRNIRQVSPGVITYEIDALDSSDNGWIEYTVATDSRKVLDSRPSEPNKGFELSPNGQKMIWTETRDSRGTLILGDQNGDNETAVKTDVNSGAVLRWIDDQHVIVSVRSSDENAHYIVNVDTGDSLKINDVFRAVYYRYYGY